ncbi:hypothetical protein NARC_180002 [Candidatus Nitrosocosmicus arcticus]|uniref:Uncharacterized protein n=1 Tax=Candidatus Nitrosocosmicus arcticus TaxID=2035267 RepID=A0A557SRG1_9ARCH|nr:hypothetical protein NARC_180002 [Candidatus Nitrosocosmicus arcticus]
MLYTHVIYLFDIKSMNQDTLNFYIISMIIKMILIKEEKTKLVLKLAMEGKPTSNSCGGACIA